MASVFLFIEKSNTNNFSSSSKTVTHPISSSNQTSPSSSLWFWATSSVISPHATPNVKRFSNNFHKVMITSTARRWQNSRWLRMIENDQWKDFCSLISDWSIRIHCQLVSEKFSWDSFIRFSRTEKWKEREQAQWTSWRMFFFNAWWIRSSPPTYCQNSPDNIWRELVVNNQKFFDFAQQGINRKLNEVSNRFSLGQTKMNIPFWEQLTWWDD